LWMSLRSALFNKLNCKSYGSVRQDIKKYAFFYPSREPIHRFEKESRE
jgi:hypothetical protein